jgi:putative oxidoreductase
MIDAETAPYATLILRIGLGVLFLAHAVRKLCVFKMAGTVTYFQLLGLPSWIAYVTVIAELSGGIALIAGVYARHVALLLMPLILGTIVTVRGENDWVFNNQRQRLGVPGLLGACAFPTVLHGRVK